MYCHTPLPEGRWGTWAAGPFLACALYKPSADGGGGDWRDSFSCGLGLFYCLKKAAFPGIGITAGRNGEFMGNFVTFQIGSGH